uniref:DUF4200 domain-containing protein n=1 Tax=Caenorhabditis tropicalis TaxID=1561998 RepID=A0A1I7SZ18_9PELO
MNSDRVAERESRLSDLEAQLESAVKEEIAENIIEGKMKVEKKREELEKLQKVFEEKLKIHRELLNANSEIMKKLEKVRQEALEELKKARKASQMAFNTKRLEISEKTYEARMIKEERLQIFDENRFDEEKKKLLDEEKTILTGRVNLEDLLKSLALETNFEAFKQECRNLTSKHRRLCIEYYNIEPELLTIHDRMKNGRKIDYCDMEGMEGLRSALRVFRETAMAFNCAGSTAEIEFQTKIEKVIEFLDPLRKTFDKIELVVDIYEGDVKPKGNEKAKDEIGPLLVAAEMSMKEIGKLIHQFMNSAFGQDQSSSTHHTNENGPPYPQKWKTTETEFEGQKYFRSLNGSAEYFKDSKLSAAGVEAIFEMRHWDLIGEIVREAAENSMERKIEHRKKKKRN